MKKITQLVSSLSAYEVKLVQKYYTMSPKIEHNLKIKLFEIALKNPAISDSEAAKLLGSRTKAAFSMLKKRLQEDIMKVLIVEGKDKIFTTKYYKARHKVHYLLMEMDVLEDRNLREQATETIFKAKKLATKYELINDLVVINDIILNGYMVRQGPTKFKKMRRLGIKELKMADELFWGTDYFKETMLPNLYKTNNKVSKSERSKLAVEKLEQLSETSDLSRIKFFHLRSKIVYFTDIKDYKNAKKTGVEFIKFIESHNILNTNDNKGGGHMMVAESSLNLKQYDEALKYVEKGIDYFYKNSLNQITMYETVFLANFYKKDFVAAKETVDYVRNLPSVKPGTFLYSKWLYYSANIEFALGDYKATLKTLKRHSFLKSDKSGWRLGYRILELMSIVELGQYDALPYRLETFRKLLSTITKENVMRPKAVLLLLNRLVKENFNFKVVSAKNQELLDALKIGENQYYWDAHGYEINRFDEWWVKKIIVK